jgi:hypothetical protein
MTGGRSLDTNIAVQRCATAKADRTLQLGNPSHNFTLIRQSRVARFSPAPDVLPFPGLFLYSRPKFASWTFSK